MVRQLAEVTLKSGQLMQCLLVEEPEARWAEDIRDLLVHKREHVHWHIDQCVAVAARRARNPLLPRCGGW